MVPGGELLDLQLVGELIELEGVDSGPETAVHRLDPERRAILGRLLAHREPASQRFVDDGLEAGSVAVGELLQGARDVVIDGQGRSHGKDIVVQAS